MKLNLTLLGLLLLGGGGCAGGPTYAPGYIEAFDAGRRAQTAGRLEEAARAFERAYKRADRVKDRDEALLLLARTQEQLGRADDARKTWRLLAEARPGGPRTVRAEFELARLAGGADEVARDAREIELIGRHPDHGMAVAALTRVVGRRREVKDWTGLLVVLDSLSPRVRGTPLEQHVDIERARALEGKGDLEAALRVYLATARAHPYPHGPRTDDAYWRASHVEEQLGRHPLAIAHLREMLGPRESSQGGGSYERPKFPAAQMRIALLLRDRLRDKGRARDELHRLADDFPDSTMRDDALWIAARIARDQGDASAACSDARRIVGSMPDSRYARCAHLLCEEVKPGARACADYLVRELRGEVSGEADDLDDDEASVREGEGVGGDGEPDPGRLRDVDAPAR